MDDTNYPGTPETDPAVERRVSRRPQARKKARWNYKRIAVALVFAVSVSAIAGYGGYTLAHMLFGGSKAKVKVASKTVTTAKPHEKESPSATTTTEAKKPNYLEHTIKSGDTYYGIALQYDTSVEKIKKLNGVSVDDNNLQVGVVLKIPTKDTVIEKEQVQAKDKKEEHVSEDKEPTSAATNIKVSTQEIVRGPAFSKRIALTFDSGVENKATPAILKALKDADVKVTFFLTGKWIEENPGLTREIAEQGHVIGNHTYSHPDLTEETDKDIAYQLSACEELVSKKVGLSTKPLFRPPYGSRDSRVLRVAADNGYRSVYWTLDSLDWKPSMTPDQVKNRILAGLSNGTIVLQHCGSSQSAEIMPDLIKEIQKKGYEIVTVPELFE